VRGGFCDVGGEVAAPFDVHATSAEARPYTPLTHHTPTVCPPCSMFFIGIRADPIGAHRASIALRAHARADAAHRRPRGPTHCGAHPENMRVALRAAPARDGMRCTAPTA
jgi:hypothetical protein